METLELIESLRADDASAAALFSGERADTPIRRGRSKAWEAKVHSFLGFIAEVQKGRRPAYHFQEAMSTDDFPSLFGDVIDRVLLGGYREYPASFDGWVRTSTVNDFRPAKRFTIDGAEGVLDPVDELAGYPEGSLDDNPFTIQVAKYGRRLAFSWEASINDDLGAFMQSTARLGRAARRSESKFVTGLYIDASGPHASLFTVGNKNIINPTNGAVATNPPLSVAGLSDAMKVIARQVDVDGEPIFATMFHLVVPPALEVTARNILNALTIEMTEMGGTAAEKLIAENWLKGSIRLHIDPYIPIVASSANGQTSWFLFADSTDGRPALEIAHLRGHEEPETFVKAPNAQRVGGGVDPMAGSFENDSIDYKVRHVFGGSRIDPKQAVSSNGSGA